MSASDIRVVKKDRWHTVQSVDCPNSTTQSSFMDAVRIWCNKPHVANRRLVGTEEVFRIRVSIKDRDVLIHKLLSTLNGCRSFSDINSLYEVIKKSLTECCCSNHSCLVCSCGIVYQPDLNATDEHESLCDVLLRCLIPKQCKVFGTVIELVILDPDCGSAVFLPVARTLDGSVHLSYKWDGSGIANDIHEPIYRIEYSVQLESEDSGRISLFTYGECVEDDASHSSCNVRWLSEILLKKLVSWSRESVLNTEATSLTLISVQRYGEVYSYLKEKYGRKLVEMWTESTDPKKFVYEDIGIAAYLMILWEDERKHKKLEMKQTFVDLGCGNGLLVYLLTSEGHAGVGLDIRKRKIWDVLGSVANLKESTVTPSDSSLFPDYDWLIGNHSDELTPWIPVMAARSGYNCRYFLLPCCPWDFDHKFSGRSQGSSIYQGYLEFVRQVGVACGFNVLSDVLRIPSTKRACFVGMTRTYTEQEMGDVELRISGYIKSRSSSNHLQDTDNHNPNLSNDSRQSNMLSQSQGSDGLLESDGKQSTWSEGFKARTAEESRKNVFRVDHSVRELVTMTTFKHLLEIEDNSITLADGRLWNRGGSIKLSELSRKFDGETLKKLKSECGGLQTLLKNCADVFKINAGSVLLRDWTSEDYVDYLSKRRARVRSDTSQRHKTKLCFYFLHHSNSCPLPSGDCRFAHGDTDLRTDSDNLKHEDL